MKLVPFHRFEIYSPLPPSAALSALSACLEERKWFRVALLPSSANDKRFSGEVTADGFNISRIIGYRNSFLPTVTGRVSPRGRGSEIVVEMRLMALVLIIALIIMLPIVAVASGTALSGGDALSVLGPIFLAALVYAIVLGGFWFEANKQERVLREIFQAA